MFDYGEGKLDYNSNDFGFGRDIYIYISIYIHIYNLNKLSKWVNQLMVEPLYVKEILST